MLTPLKGAGNLDRTGAAKAEMLAAELKEVMNMPSTLAETRSSIQFVVMSLGMAFDLKPK